jgi:hypothetical protein
MGFDGRDRPGGGRPGQDAGLLVRGQGSGGVAEVECRQTPFVQCLGEPRPLHCAGYRMRGQPAADRHRLLVGLEGLWLLADAVDQLAQLHVRLGQHPLRRGVGLALEQVAQLVVGPPGRVQRLIPQ